MRVLSALTSSFILASVVLEHSKLFARTQLPAGSSTGPSGGWEKFIALNDQLSRFSSIEASFNIPEVEAGPGDGLFWGVTLGDPSAASCLGPTVGISAGVVVYIGAAGTATYLPVYQVSQYNFEGVLQNELVVVEQAPFVIAAGDSMLVMITIIGNSRAVVLMTHFGQQEGDIGRAAIAYPEIPRQSLCEVRYARWGIAELKDWFRAFPLVWFEPAITFRGAKVFRNHAYAEGAGDGIPVGRPKNLWDGRRMVAETSLEILTGEVTVSRTGTRTNTLA